MDSRRIFDAAAPGHRYIVFVLVDHELSVVCVSFFVSLMVLPSVFTETTLTFDFMFWFPAPAAPTCFIASIAAWLP